jgi:hypothetical protein
MEKILIQELLEIKKLVKSISNSTLENAIFEFKKLMKIVNEMRICDNNLCKFNCKACIEENTCQLHSTLVHEPEKVKSVCEYYHQLPCEKCKLVLNKI